MPKGNEITPTRWDIIRAHLNREGEASPAELHNKIRLVYITQTMDMTRKLLSILVKDNKISSPRWGLYELVYKASKSPAEQAAAATAPPTPVKAPEPQAQAPQQAIQRQTESQTKQLMGSLANRKTTDTGKPEEKFFVIAETSGGPIKITYTGSIRVEFLP